MAVTSSGIGERGEVAAFNRGGLAIRREAEGRQSVNHGRWALGKGARQQRGNHLQWALGGKAAALTQALGGGARLGLGYAQVARYMHSYAVSDHTLRILQVSFPFPFFTASY